MHTPSLRRRVLGSGLGVFLVVILALEAFVLLSLREQLDRNLEEVLAARVQVAREVANEADVDDLPQQLRALGVTAVVTTAEGQQVDGLPAVPRFGSGPPGPASALDGPFISERVPLPDGGEIQVLATRAGVEATLRRVLLLMLAGTVVALVLGALLLRRATAVAIAPLGDIAAAADRTARGHLGERLRPDDPSTELGHLAVAYDQMLDSLEAAADRARDEEERSRRFLDDAAHQLRTPIAGIRASVETLLSTDDPVHRDRLMANLVRETSRSSRVLRDLLTMARLDTGRPPAPQPTDLVALCRDEVERTQSLAPELAVTCTTGQPGPVQADIDPSAIREAVANLLDNARRHAESTIEVAVREDAGGWTIDVHDDGPGVAPEARALIFERFATLDGLGGSGLGLPIARSIARAHGGDLECHDHGFRLRLCREHRGNDVATRGAVTDDGADPGYDEVTTRVSLPPPDA
jgi:two-component system, OmpR family, sensor kinase